MTHVQRKLIVFADGRDERKVQRMQRFAARNGLGFEHRLTIRDNILETALTIKDRFWEGKRPITNYHSPPTDPHIYVALSGIPSEEGGARIVVLGRYTLSEGRRHGIFIGPNTGVLTLAAPLDTCLENSRILVTEPGKEIEKLEYTIQEALEGRFHGTRSTALINKIKAVLQPLGGEYVNHAARRKGYVLRADGDCLEIGLSCTPRIRDITIARIGLGFFSRTSFQEESLQVRIGTQESGLAFFTEVRGPMEPLDEPKIVLRGVDPRLVQQVGAHIGLHAEYGDLVPTVGFSLPKGETVH